MEVRYIDNIKENGIEYNIDSIIKEFKKLKVPKSVYDVTKLPIKHATYFTLLSERSTGKTTNILLLGMVANWITDGMCKIAYIRKTENMILNQTIDQLFKTIREYGYIEKVTHGKWNSIFYYSRKWYYCLTDEDGKIIEKSPEPFMYCMAINKRDDYKSSFTGWGYDFIIYDEFIDDRYKLNEFVHFCDLLKTIIRSRKGIIGIFMLANTIDKHSEYFSEMEIYEDIQLIEIGKHEIITTQKGTKIYVELIKDAKDEKEKKMLNSMFFGFKNPQISSITGDDWAFSDYPHIESGYKTIQHGIYIDYHDKLLELEIVEYDDVGIYINVHRASKTYDDSIIYCNAERKDNRYRFHMGEGDRLDKFIHFCIINHRIRFHDNSCGTIFFNHCNTK